MGNDDLEAIKSRVEESRSDFLTALESYDEDDGKQIIEKFLADFLVDRVDIVKEHATEAIGLINTFEGQRLSLMASISLAKMKMEHGITALMVDFLHKIITGFPQYQDASASPLEQLKKFQQDLKAHEQLVATSGDSAIENAIEFGTHIDTLQRMATNVLQMRTLTLKAFKDENLRLSPGELIQRIRDGLWEESKSLAYEKAWEEARKRLDELMDIALEEEPFHRGIKIIEKVIKVFSKKVNTSPCGTDTMYKLLGRLREENSALIVINNTYDETMSNFDRLSRKKGS